MADERNEHCAVCIRHALVWGNAYYAVWRDEHQHLNPLTVTEPLADGITAVRMHDLTEGDMDTEVARAAVKAIHERAAAPAHEKEG